MNSRISFFYPLIVQQLLTVSAEVFKINKPVILIEFLNRRRSILAANRTKIKDIEINIEIFDT